jgi:hypothetical protein
MSERRKFKRIALLLTLGRVRYKSETPRPMTTSLRGGFVPRALAAFVKRPQAALLKSALCLFYRATVIGVKRMVLSFFPTFEA